MTNPMTTTGDTIYSSSGSTPARLGIGSTGQVLTVAAGVPSWATPAGGGGKVLQVVQGTTTTTTTVASTTYADTTLTATITPSAATSKILVMYTQQVRIAGGATKDQGVGVKLFRGATLINDNAASRGSDYRSFDISGTMTEFNTTCLINSSFLDSPATTSATTYKTQGASTKTANGSSVIFQNEGATCQSTIILMEIGA
jgi:hypothetical protein